MNHPLSLDRLAFVDIETSGAHANSDRIIEIAIITVDKGQVSQTWSSLVNPECRLSGFIEGYTGIRTEDVASAPLFSEIAQKVQSLLSDRVFIAHNVRFDYGFIKNEFLRAGVQWTSDQLCTVKLSRKLYPQFRKHSLDALIDRFGFWCSDRHRALGDTEVLIQFWNKIHEEFGEDIVIESARDVMKLPAVPLHIEPEIIKKLPDTPGVYYFYGESEKPMYIGKSVDIKKRVLSHFTSDNKTSKGAKIAKQLRRIEYTQTVGELQALLHESREIKRHLPVYNRQLRRDWNLFSLMLEPNEDGYKEVKIVQKQHILVDELPLIASVFKSERQAKEVLSDIAKKYDLCDKLVGLEKSNRECFKYHLKKCKGACCGDEHVDIYNARQELAFQNMQIKSWPFDGVLGLREVNKLTGDAVVHVVYKWCYLGTAHEEADIENFIEQIDELYFDYDTYKILLNYIPYPKKPSKIARVEHINIPLSVSHY